MIFNELYSAYYKTVAEILKEVNFNRDEKHLNEIVLKNAFSESVLTILPNLKSGKWPLVTSDFTPILENTPSFPLTELERRWLKSISLDKRIRLFDFEIPALDDVIPLFTSEDYKLFDQYSDGDPYDDLGYIRSFKLIRRAIEEERQVTAKILGRNNKAFNMRFIPTGLEYSPKDDKFRVIIKGAEYSQINLAKVLSCTFYTGNKPLLETKQIPVKEVNIIIEDERNALERVMLHFAHFEKEALRIDDKKYRLKLKYLENDETEILIRILSFGPLIKVESPDEFITLIKNRLYKQKACEI